ncbi:putative DNA-binding domain-containing protein [Pokkaliibacter sp. CJK22405]|uniref:HvfC/BufC family peptide modification chaperone n=1 Tax=Pokkaliibacter sp. CJK22405 TaxID=3384615 RepID=UPI00398514F2
MLIYRETLQALRDAILKEEAPRQANIKPMPGHGLEVYSNNRRVVLKSSLAAAYPVVKRIVGDEAFGLLCHHYLADVASISGNLHLFGVSLPDFIATTPLAEQLPYLIDVASLEWARHYCYYAPDSRDFDLSRLEAVDPEQLGLLVLRFAPAIRLIQSAYPIMSIWQFNQPEFSGAFTDLDQGAQAVAVTRPYGQVDMRTLSSDEAQVLAALQRGHTLSDALEHRSGDDLDFQALLGWLIQQRAIMQMALGEAG